MQRVNFNCPHCKRDLQQDVTQEVFDWMLYQAIQVTCPMCAKGILVARQIESSPSAPPAVQQMAKDAEMLLYLIGGAMVIGGLVALLSEVNQERG